MSKSDKLFLIVITIFFVIGNAIPIMLLTTIRKEQCILEYKVDAMDALGEFRSPEHRYFLLLHKVKESGDIEKEELRYYNYLKQFYRVENAKR